MSQSNKKSNKLFYILLILIVLLSLISTFVSIYFANKKATIDDEKNNDVKESDTLTVYKKYPINPLKYTYDKNQIYILEISGLKNKKIQDKINERIKENEYCYLEASFSNILSISCDNESINIDLTTGNDIKYEEIFQKDTNIDEKLMKMLYDAMISGESYHYYLFSLYDQYYSDMYEDFDEFREHFSDFDSFILKEMEKFKKSFYIGWHFLGYNSMMGENLSFRDFYETIAIYDRFLTNENIFENEVEDYFYPLVTNYYPSIDDDYYADFVDEKTFLEFNYYDYSIEKELSSTEREKIKDNLFNYITENLDNTDKYQYNNYYVTLDNVVAITDSSLYLAFVQYSTINLDKKDFEIYISSGKKDDSELKTKLLFLDKNYNIIEKENDPYKYFDDFEIKFYKFIKGYCEFGNFDQPDACYNVGEIGDVKKMLSNYSFGVDKENKILHFYYYSPFGSWTYYVSFDRLNKEEVTNLDKNNLQ